MATVKPTSYAHLGSYNAQWAAIETSIFKPQYLPTVYKVYGDHLNLTNTLDLAGKKMNVPNTTMKHFESYAPNYAFTTSGTIASGTGDITFKISTSDYNSLNKPPIRQYDVIQIPRKYMTSGVGESRGYRIESTSGSGNDLTFTARPINSDGTYDTASEIGTTIPSGTTLFVSHTIFGRGTGQPEPKTDNWTTREHVATLCKESEEYEGGHIAQAFEEPIIADMRNGNKGIITKGISSVGVKLSYQIENAFLLGERSDNTSMTDTSQAGSYSGSPISGWGMYRWANMLAQDASHSGDVIDIDHMYARKQLLQSQAMSSKLITILCGWRYKDKLERGGAEMLQQYSSTDILDASKVIGFEFNGYKLGGITYVPVELGIFSDPSRYGINVSDLDSYEWPSSGLYIPNVRNKIKIGNKMLPSVDNIMIGYVSNNEEDRSRVVGIEAGPNNIFPSQIVSHEYDKIEIYMFAEIMPICVNVNQWIYDRATGS